MARYVSYDALIEHLDACASEIEAENTILWATTIAVRSFVEQMPAEDVAPVRRGEWEQLKSHEENFDFRCSACHKFRFHNGELSRKYKYCPNCGAKMDKTSGVTDGE